MTKDSRDQVIAFYRKALAKYGEVLECNHGKPVGSLTVTKSGLTCGDHNGRPTTPNGNDGDYELGRELRNDSASSRLTAPTRRKQSLGWWRWWFRKKRMGSRAIRLGSNEMGSCKVWFSVPAAKGSGWKLPRTPFPELAGRSASRRGCHAGITALNSYSKPHPPQTRATHLKRLYRTCPPEMLWLPDFASGQSR